MSPLLSIPIPRHGTRASSPKFKVLFFISTLEWNIYRLEIWITLDFLNVISTVLCRKRVPLIFSLLVVDAAPSFYLFDYLCGFITIDLTCIYVQKENGAIPSWMGSYWSSAWGFEGWFRILGCTFDFIYVSFDTVKVNFIIYHIYRINIKKTLNSGILNIKIYCVSTFKYEITVQIANIKVN